MPSGSNRSAKPSWSPATRGSALPISAARSARGVSMLCEADRLRQCERALAARERVGGGAHVIGRLDHGQVDEIDIGAGDRVEIGVEVQRRQAVDADDDDLAVGARPPRAQERSDRAACLALAALLDRVLEIERDRIRLARDWRTARAATPGRTACCAWGKSAVVLRAASFDHLVGAAEEREREGDAEGLGCLEVDEQLDFGDLLHRQISRLVALDDASGIDPC